MSVARSCDHAAAGPSRRAVFGARVEREHLVEIPELGTEDCGLVAAAFAGDPVRRASRHFGAVYKGLPRSEKPHHFAVWNREGIFLRYLAL